MLTIPTANAGRWWVPGARARASNSGVILADDTISYRPFFVCREIRVSDMAIKTAAATTAGVSALRFGIYSSDELGLPQTLLTQTEDITFGGAASNTVLSAATTPAFSLWPGRLYYIAVIVRTDATAKMTNTPMTGAGILTLGGTTILEATDSTADAHMITHAATAWVGMPNPADMSSPTFTTSGNGPPNIGAKVATGFNGEGPGHAPLAYPYANETRWHIANLIGNGVTTAGSVDGSVKYVPFFSSAPGSIAKLAIEVTTARASSNGRIGIYSSHSSTGLPDVLLAETEEVDSSTTGVKELAITKVTLVAKTNYWLAYGSSGGAGNVNLRGLNWASAGAKWSDIGAGSAADVTDTGQRAGFVTSAGFLAATGLPDPAASLSYVAANNNLPRIAFELTT